MKECWLVSWKDVQDMWNESLIYYPNVVSSYVSTLVEIATEIGVIKGYENNGEFFEYTEE